MSDRALILASRNRKKVEELHRILLATGLDVTVLGVADVPGVPEVPETGATFAENATAKAVAVAEATGMVAVADDSGLCVDALNGMPGVLSARWSGSHGDDDTNLRLLLDQLGDVPDDRRGAGFQCAAAAARPGADGIELLVREGEVRGHLLREARGRNGFGYDPIFVPEGHTRTTAELSSEEKDAISHRGRALRDLVGAMRTWWPISPDRAG